VPDSRLREAILGPGKGPNCFVAPAYALARFGGLAPLAKLAQRAKARLLVAMTT
jgi:hypothetical protein